MQNILLNAAQVKALAHHMIDHPDSSLLLVNADATAIGYQPVRLTMGRGDTIDVDIDGTVVDPVLS